VTNGVQDLALAFEPGSPEVLRRPPRPRREGILSPTMWERTAVTGLVMALGALALFRWELDRSGSLVAAQTVALTTLVIFNVFQVGNARSETRSLFALSPFGNRFLLGATLVAVTLHVVALHLPATQYVLGVEPIDLEAWRNAVLVATSILVASEAHKAVRRRWPLRVKP
jgi:Ca2+-transporting ATPase